MDDSLIDEVVGLLSQLPHDEQLKVLDYINALQEVSSLNEQNSN